MNTSTQLFNAVETADLSAVQSIVHAYAEVKGRPTPETVSILTNRRSTTCDATAIHLACCLYRKAVMSSNSTLADTYDRIIEVLSKDGYASLTIEMNRKFDRRTGALVDGSGCTIFQLFGQHLSPYVKAYMKSVNMSTYDKHTAVVEY
ncbi:hypothetical protein [Stenotrophomonas sp. PS02301]|uniref:hypothetical protein n=1 Tax=Stenotrophomonas sp. PS02301 TaxID=2991427 RepID=UPI00249A0C9C|nr:hypothetical protein [Stenotrophomonas sp. PS02301]